MKRLLRILDLIAYALYRCLAAIICALPISWGFRLGRLGGGGISLSHRLLHVQ